MRIGLTGTQSTGKTTLVKSLSKLDYFKDYHISTERSKYLRDLGIPLNTDSTLNGQSIFLAERTSELLRDNLLTDRTVLDVMAFASNSHSMEIKSKEAFKDFAKLFIPQYDYIFYLSPIGIEIENNGVRETNSLYRSIIDLTIQNYITGYKNKIKKLIKVPPGLDNANRVEFIMSHLT